MLAKPSSSALCAARGCYDPRGEPSLWRSLETRGGHTRTSAHRQGAYAYMEVCHVGVVVAIMRARLLQCAPSVTVKQPSHACGRGHVDSREIARLTRHHRSLRSSVPLQFTCISLNVQGVCLRHGSNAAQQPTTQLRRGDAMPRRALKAGNVFFQESHWIHIHGSIG